MSNDPQPSTRLQATGDLSAQPDATIPAFESALGLAPPDAVRVDPAALAQITKEQTPAVTRYSAEAAHVASLFAKKAVRPDEVAALRREMFETVSRRMGDVEAVMEGKKSWNAGQVRLFSLMVERVLPKLTNVKVTDESKPKLEDLTIEELEKIALGQRKAAAVDAVVNEGIELDEMAEKHERRAGKAEVIRQLGYTSAVDDAEIAYAARQVDVKGEAAENQHKVKISQILTPEQHEAMLKKNKRSLSQKWADMGFTEAEIAEKEAARQAKIQKNGAKVRAAKAIRLGIQGGLGDAAQVARDIESKRREISRSFRVPGRKGVRSQTAIQKEAAEEKARDDRALEKRNNPRVRIGRVLEGLPDGIDVDHIGLEVIREYRPDVLRATPRKKK